MYTMQVRIWRYMLQTFESHNIIQKPTNRQNLKKNYGVNCKTECAIPLMEITLCNLQYVSKNEILFNIKLNNLLKNEKDPKSILADKPFQKCCHRFNEHASFTIHRFLRHAFNILLQLT